MHVSILPTGLGAKPSRVLQVWKSIFLVLRPDTISIYKSDKESKLRHKIYLSDLSAVTLLRDPKQKRHNLFGLFCPARNFHLEAQSLKDAQEWIELIRQGARIEEEEEGMFLASPVIRRQSFAAVGVLSSAKSSIPPKSAPSENERIASSSPEPVEPLPSSQGMSVLTRAPSHPQDPSGMAANDFISHSDFSDCEPARAGTSLENLSGGSPTSPSSAAAGQLRPMIGGRNTSQLSGLTAENDPDRVVWQGWLQLLKTKRGVKQWKHCWAVLRPRNLILYKNESEYMATFILPLSTVVNVVDIDPISKTKLHCMQIITDEKSYRFCTQDEETLVQCLGAFKSLLSKRKELEARQKEVASGNVASS